jgi:hypothetical protein
MDKKKIIIKVKECDKLVALDDVECGKMFVGNLNDGYECLIGNKDDPFKCYHWNCPLATSADLSIIKRLDRYSFDEVCEYFDLKPDEAINFSDEELQKYNPSSYCDEYMHQYLQVVDIECKESIEPIRTLIRTAKEDDIEMLNKTFEVEILKIK